MTTDAAKELNKALDAFRKTRIAPAIGPGCINDKIYATLVRDGHLISSVLRHLPALLAEIDRLRAAMGEDIETRQGFSGHATEAMR